MENLTRHLDEFIEPPFTAHDVVDVFDVAENIADDNWHFLIRVGARRMVHDLQGHWIYQAGWNASTLWRNPDDPDETVVIFYDGSRERPYQRDRRLASGSA